METRDHWERLENPAYKDSWDYQELQEPSAVLAQEDLRDFVAQTVHLVR